MSNVSQIRGKYQKMTRGGIVYSAYADAVTLVAAVNTTYTGLVLSNPKANTKVFEFHSYIRPHS